MACGRIPRVCLLVAAGAVTARRQSTTAKFLRRRNCAIFAISATRERVRGFRVNACGIRYGFMCVPSHPMRTPGFAGFSCATYVNANIFLRNTVSWNSISPGAAGRGRIRIHGCSAWRSVLLRRIARELGLTAWRSRPQFETSRSARLRRWKKI
jgi:hypothetical protein